MSTASVAMTLYLLLTVINEMVYVHKHMQWKKDLMVFIFAWCAHSEHSRISNAFTALFVRSCHWCITWKAHAKQELSLTCCCGGVSRCFSFVQRPKNHRRMLTFAVRAVISREATATGSAVAGLFFWQRRPAALVLVQRAPGRANAPVQTSRNAWAARCWALKRNRKWQTTKQQLRFRQTTDKTLRESLELKPWPKTCKMRVMYLHAAHVSVQRCHVTTDVSEIQTRKKFAQSTPQLLSARTAVTNMLHQNQHQNEVFVKQNSLLSPQKRKAYAAKSLSSHAKQHFRRKDFRLFTNRSRTGLHPSSLHRAQGPSRHISVVAGLLRALHSVFGRTTFPTPHHTRLWRMPVPQVTIHCTNQVK